MSLQWLKIIKFLTRIHNLFAMLLLPRSWMEIYCFPISHGPPSRLYWWKCNLNHAKAKTNINNLKFTWCLPYTCQSWLYSFIIQSYLPAWWWHSNFMGLNWNGSSSSRLENTCISYMKYVAELKQDLLQMMYKHIFSRI